MTAGFGYDVLGNVITATDAKGTVITNAYDKANRVTTRSYNDGTTPTVNFFYDGKGLASLQSPYNFAKGKLTKVTSSVSETQNTLFDNFGRLTETKQITDGNTYTSRYEYNFSGALIKETYPSGREVKNEFESDGDLARIYGKVNATAVERTYANSFTYTPDGKIERLRLGNGLWEAAKFNTRLQTTEIALGYGVSSGDLWKIGYEYGELNTDGTVNTTKNTGNIAKQTVNFNGLSQPFIQSYIYDSLYRLTEARETAGTASNAPQTWKENFTYDRYGNRLTHDKFVGATQITQTNITNPTIDPITNRFQTGQGFSFDRNGNLSADAESRAFTFNGDNKQTKVIQNGQLVGEYFFDGEGKRVKKKAYSSGLITEETIFVYSSGKMIAEYSTKPLPPNPTTSYTATDQLGSPRVITNSLGEVVSRRDFTPFGEQVYSDANYRPTNLKYNSGDDLRQKFTGYQKDEETKLDFAEARMYENRHGRFTAVDPLLASGKSANPQSFNRYVYVLNNPIRFTDPNGLQAGTSPSDYGYNVYFRTFAPFEWFGGFGTNAFRGDGVDRKFSPDLTGPDSSYRMSAVSVANSGGGYFPAVFTHASRPAVSLNGYSPIQNLLTGGNLSECSISDERYGVNIGQGGFGARTSFHMSGNDDAVLDLDIFPFNTVAWDIDKTVSWETNFSNQVSNGNTMTITGWVKGDGFPAAESFIYDGFGTGVMLGAYAAPPDEWGPEPETRLAGENERSMLFFNVNILVRDGRFTGVMENDNIVPIEKWNERFRSLPTRSTP